MVRTVRDRIGKRRGWMPRAVCALALITVCVFVLSGAVYGSPEGEQAEVDAEDKDQPETEIEAESLSYDGREDKIRAEENVVILRNGTRLKSDYAEFERANNFLFARGEVFLEEEDEEEGFRLWCDELEVELDREYYVATGNVRIETRDIEATAGRATYRGEEDVLVLTEDPVARQRGNTISGDEITVYVREDRMRAEGRTRAVLEE